MPDSTQTPEAIVRTFSTHWVKYVGPVLIYVLLTSGGLLLFYMANLSAHHSMVVSHGTFFLALLLTLFSHHWFFQSLLSESMDDVIITNKRVIHLKECLYLCNDMHEIPLERVHAVEVRKHGVIQNMLRYGSLWFDTGGAVTRDTGRVVNRVPHPHQVAKEIMSLLEMK